MKVEHDVEGEKVLLSRCRAGELSALEELYHAHASRVYAVVIRLLGCRLEADDLTQEVFLTVFRRLATFRGDAALSTWIHRIAVNRCVDYLRSRGAGFADASRELDDQILPAGAPRRMERLLVDRLDLEQAIASLPDGYRAAFVLHDVEGLRHAEVGDALGIAPGTSKSQVHKARLRLRELLSTRRGGEKGADHVRAAVR